MVLVMLLGASVAAGMGGEKVYREDFTDPASIGAGAGPGPGLDETRVENGGLVQITGLSGIAGTDFAAASGHTFDPLLLEVSSGVARVLPDSLWPSVIGLWRFEASGGWTGTPGEVVDSSGNGLGGSVLGDVSSVPGLLGNAAAFDGTGDAIGLGQPSALDLDPTSDFTIATWFRATGNAALVSKADADFASRQFYLFVFDGKLWGAVGGEQQSGTISGASDGAWHHGALVCFDDAGTRRFALYLDGVADSVFPAGTSTNSVDVLIGARRNSGTDGLAFPLNGEIDEVVMLDRALSAEEIAGLYNAGVGRVLGAYPTPAAVSETAGDTLFNVSALSGFNAIPGAGHLGDLGFQLSADGVDWRYWDGAAWSPAGVSDHTDAAAVDANLAAFDISGGRIFIRSLLLSGATAPAELDAVSVAYDRSPVFISREVIGPVAAGFSFLELRATVAAEDPDHAVTFRVLEADGSTPVDEGLLPGNLLGLDSVAVGAGVDLSSLPPGDLYLELSFSNLLADSASAVVDELTVTYLDAAQAPDMAILSLDPLADPHPVEQMLDLTFEVANVGNLEALNATFEIILPAELVAVSSSWPSGWSCQAPGSSWVCSAEGAVPAGSASLWFTLSVQVVDQNPQSNPLQLTAQASASDDADPGNGSRVERVTLGPPTSAVLEVEKQAFPRDGVDSSFRVVGPGVVELFGLDDASPDDADGVGSLVTLALPPAVYTVTETPPAGWRTDAITCTGVAEQRWFETSFTDPAELLYDSSSIEVAGGVARLLPDPLAPDLVADWRFEELSWGGTAGEVVNSAGTGLGGTALGDATPGDGGRLGRMASFDGLGDAIGLGQPAELDLVPTSAYTVSVWFRTTGDGALVAKADSVFGQRQVYLFVSGGSLWGAVGGSQSQGSSSGVSDGAWHHGALVNELSGGTWRYTLYLDGAADGTFVSGTAVNPYDVLLGARRDVGNSGLAFSLNGQLDEVSIFGRALDVDEIADLYNAGSGRRITAFPTGGVSITRLVGQANGSLVSLDGFEATSGVGSAGDLRFQLSRDGVDWHFWNGASWAPAGVGDHSSEAEVDAAISAFPFDGGLDRLWVRGFLLSDGTQPVAVDHWRVGYWTQAPIAVPAGQEATVSLEDHQRVRCTFNDVEDVVEPGSITLLQSTSPPTGVDFTYTSSDLVPGTFVLDDAQPDDGDAVPGALVFEDLESGSYLVQQASEPIWPLDDVVCTSNSIASRFQVTFDDASAYAFDGSEIEVAGGEAHLLSDALASNLAGYWRFEEGAWAGSAGEVLDSSGNGSHGTTIGNAAVSPSGKLGGGADFSGAGAVTLGQPPGLDFDPSAQEFTVSAWFRATGDGGLIGKAEDDFGQRQYYLFVAGNRLQANVGGVQTAQSSTGATDGAWHLGTLVNVDDGGVKRHRLYLDGVLQGTFVSGASTNGADLLIGARRLPGNTGLGFPLDGEIDEVAIFDRALTTAEVVGLYAAGSGRVLGGFPSPSADLVVGPLSDVSIKHFTGFQESPGTGHQGGLAYQLSTDGADWRFWNGSAWMVASGTGEHNSAAEVNAAIGTFDALPGTLWVRVLLLSDGSQAAALDRLEITYQGSGLGGVSRVGNSLSLELAEGQDIVCSFLNSLGPVALSALAVQVEATVTDGTDFPFTGDLGSFSLDHAVPDDLDGPQQQFSASSLIPGTYDLFEQVPSGWTIDSIECQRRVSEAAQVVHYFSADDYLFDSAAIDFSGGRAQLVEDPLVGDVLAYWRFEEPAWSGGAGEVADTSGQGHDGSIVGAPQPVAGHLGGAASFAGTSSAISFGAPPALDLDPATAEFTVSAWFRATGDGAIVGKADGVLANRQFYLFALEDKLWAIIGGNLSSGVTSGASDGAWHHAVVSNYDAGVEMRHRLYLDGNLEGDFLSGGQTNLADILVGARRVDGNTGLAFELDGEVDDVLILGRALDSGEVASLYQGGVGRVLTRYPTGAHQVTPKAGFQDGTIAGFSGFQTFPTPGSTGDLDFQISADGADWRYFDGFAWVPAATAEQTNDAATVDSAIHLFDASAQTLFVRAFLVSDGSEPAGIDAFEVFWTVDPVVQHTVAGASVSVEVEPGADILCIFHNAEQPPLPTALTVRVQAQPADGTDFLFSGPFTSPLEYSLDHAEPDDGDGVDQQIVYAPIGAGTYAVWSSGATGWTLDDVLCVGGATPPYFTADPAGGWWNLPVANGENVVCTFHYSDGQPVITLTQETDTFGSDHRWVATPEDGRELAFTSTADLTGGNAGQQREVFWRSDSGFEQVTFAQGSEQDDLAVSGRARWLVFSSDADLLGANPDLNREVFLWDTGAGILTQLTFTTNCFNAVPSVDETPIVAFVTSCSDLFPGSNPDGSFEIVVWEAGSFDGIETGSCFGRNPKISQGDGGRYITFASACDLTGGNADGGEEVFQWDRTDPVDPWRQITDTGTTTGLLTFAASGDGARVAWVTGSYDGTSFTQKLDLWRRETGAIEELIAPVVQSVPDAVVIDTSGSHVVVAIREEGGVSYNLRHFEVDAAGIVATTELLPAPFTSFDSLEGQLAVGATEDLLRVFFISTDDYTGGNGDLGEEIFSVTVQ